MSTAAYPVAPLAALDTLWLQVAGTLCNLQCTHCFISCSPANHAHEMMDLADVRARLAEAERLGVREYYVTGGEPFLHRDILPILEACLAQGPTSVLTNGVLVRRETAERLRALADASPYTLDLRISLDGYDAGTNDPIRGAGTFERILAGIRHLVGAGLTPIVTVTEACAGAGASSGRARFLAFLREAGMDKPRLKVMPLLRIGAEAARLRGYQPGESLRGMDLDPAAVHGLQCASGRAVTARGVYVCPILVDFPGARLGETLAEAMRPFELRYPACYTCHVEGLTCRT